MNAVEKCITSVSGVLGTYDLHVWTVGPGAIACSCHILVAEQSIRDGQQILRMVAEELEHHYRINHCTIQVEVEGHAANEMYCCIKPPVARKPKDGAQRHDHCGH
jgi:cobalt-zinc-cadmium efflux system protein